MFYRAHLIIFLVTVLALDPCSWEILRSPVHLPLSPFQVVDVALFIIPVSVLWPIYLLPYGAPLHPLCALSTIVAIVGFGLQFAWQAEHKASEIIRLTVFGLGTLAWMYAGLWQIYAVSLAI